MRIAQCLLAALLLSLCATPGLTQRGGHKAAGVDDDYNPGSPDGSTIGIGASAGTQRENAPLPPATDGRYDVQDPDWTQLPVVASHYPQQAFEQKVSGVVLLHCAISSNGSLSRCSTSDEKPAGVGFAKAALDMAPLFQMRRSDLDGHPVAYHTVSITIWFDLPAV
jgi:hypothetical protein